MIVRSIDHAVDQLIDGSVVQFINERWLDRSNDEVDLVIYFAGLMVKDLRKNWFLDCGPVEFTGKTSNGRKIARIARILTIFGPNESSRRDLFFENVWKDRNK